MNVVNNTTVIEHRETNSPGRFTGAVQQVLPCTLFPIDRTTLGTVYRLLQLIFQRSIHILQPLVFALLPRYIRLDPTLVEYSLSHVLLISKYDIFINTKEGNKRRWERQDGFDQLLHRSLEILFFLRF